jgi:hypothetical protein
MEIADSLPDNLFIYALHAISDWKDILTLSPKLSTRSFLLISQTFEKLSERDSQSNNIWIAKLFLALSSRAPRDESIKHLQAWLGRTNEVNRDNADAVISSLIALLSPALTPELKEAFVKIVRADHADLDLKCIGAAILLNYAPDDMASWATEAVLQPLASLQRPVVLAALSICEGEWGEIFQIHPAINNGLTPMGLLSRAGGQSTFQELVSAVLEIKEWWP